MKVYVTRYNFDMTEGRGPMVNDKCFLHKKDAENYIDNQCGVMGIRRKWSEDKYGDWDVIELDVLEGPFNIEEDIKNKALAKLSEEEKRVIIKYWKQK